jgi:hypothetical protein
MTATLEAPAAICLFQGGQIVIVPSTFFMRCIMGAEVVATRENTLTPRSPVDMGCFSRMTCQMTIEGLSTFKTALAVWKTAFQLGQQDVCWYALVAHVEGSGIQSLRLGEETVAGLSNKRIPASVM